MQAFELVQKLIAVEKSLKIKCIHNEFAIIAALATFGPLTLEDTRVYAHRSASGHENDLRRLRQLGHVTRESLPEDLRRCQYQIRHTTAVALSSALAPPHVGSKLAYGEAGAINLA